jgi:hypothetical protein
MKKTEEQILNYRRQNSDLIDRIKKSTVLDQELVEVTTK